MTDALLHIRIHRVFFRAFTSESRGVPYANKFRCTSSAMSAKILQNDKVDKKTDYFSDSVTLFNMASIEFVRITGCDISFNKGIRSET